MGTACSHGQLAAVAEWLRGANERQSGIAALPVEQRDRAHRANERLRRLVRARRSR